MYNYFWIELTSKSSVASKMFDSSHITAFSSKSEIMLLQIWRENKNHVTECFIKPNTKLNSNEYLINQSLVCCLTILGTILWNYFFSKKILVCTEHDCYSELIKFNWTKLWSHSSLNRKFCRMRPLHFRRIGKKIADAKKMTHTSTRHIQTFFNVDIGAVYTNNAFSTNIEGPKLSRTYAIPLRIKVFIWINCRYTFFFQREIRFQCGY